MKIEQKKMVAIQPSECEIAKTGKKVYAYTILGVDYRTFALSNKEAISNIENHIITLSYRNGCRNLVKIEYSVGFITIYRVSKRKVFDAYKRGQQHTLELFQNFVASGDNDSVLLFEKGFFEEGLPIPTDVYRKLSRNYGNKKS